MNRTLDSHHRSRSRKSHYQPRLEQLEAKILLFNWGGLLTGAFDFSHFGLSGLLGDLGSGITGDSSASSLDSFGDTPFSDPSTSSLTASLVPSLENSDGIDWGQLLQPNGNATLPSDLFNGFGSLTNALASTMGSTSDSFVTQLEQLLGANGGTGSNPSSGGAASGSRPTGSGSPSLGNIVGTVFSSVGGLYSNSWLGLGLETIGSLLTGKSFNFQPPAPPKPPATTPAKSPTSTPPAKPPANTAPVTALNGSFVNQVYSALLDRPADTGGLANWTAALDQNNLASSQFVDQILSSPEFNTDTLNNLYTAYLNRPADSSGLVSWGNLLNQGGSLQQVEAGLLGSPEYYAKQGGTATGFVDGLYRDVLSRTPDSAGLTAWTTNLAEGVSPSLVASSFVSSPEANRDAVGKLFQTYLHRSPDPSGQATFTSFLQNGGDSRQVIASMLTSPEYAQNDVAPDMNAQAVGALYPLVLGRNADWSGWTNFSEGVDFGKMSLNDVLTNMASSSEFRQNEVSQLYTRFLHHAASADTMRSLTGVLSKGATTAQISADILGSPEYYTQRGGGNDLGYLQAVYQDVLGHPLDLAGWLQWGGDLSQGASRTQVADALMTSPDYWISTGSPVS